MNVHGKVKVWHLTPEQMANYHPGMDLGEPHEIIDPIPFEPIPYLISNPDKFYRDQKQRVKRGVETRFKGRPLITPELYEIERDAGLSNSEIAERYEIQLKTLKQYVSKWRKEGCLG